MQSVLFTAFQAFQTGECFADTLRNSNVGSNEFKIRCLL